jgi:hypothetical protein
MQRGQDREEKEPKALVTITVTWHDRTLRQKEVAEIVSREAVSVCFYTPLTGQQLHANKNLQVLN